MDDGPDDRTPSLVPRLAWQPAEAALTGLAEPVAVAAEERRSTMVPQGAHQKDVQWNRIRCAGARVAAPLPRSARLAVPR